MNALRRLEFRSDVTWYSPSSEDKYGSGDSILAKWLAKEFNAPTFSLCSRADGCSPVATTAIMQTGGFYQAMITVPEVQNSGTYYLEVEDSGQKMQSPTFHLSPQGASSPPISDQDANLQAPLASESTPSSSSFLLPSTTTTSSTIASLLSLPSPSTSPLNPNLLSAPNHNSRQTAAFVIPLSAVGAAVLLLGALFIRHRRNQRKEWVKDAQRRDRAQSRARRDSLSSSYSTSKGSEFDQAALHVLPRHQLVPYGRPSAVATFLPPESSYASPVPPPVPVYAPTYADLPYPGSHEPEERPRLPPIATTAGSFMSSANHEPAITSAVLSDYMLPSPPLCSATSGPTPRCLLPAPQRLYLRDDDTKRHHPLGTPPSERDENELYARVESKLYGH